MEEEKKHIDELIATYLTEGLDKNALAELKAWIAASPENKNYFIQQREVWFSAVSREAASKYNKDKAFDTFKKRIGNRKEIEKTSHHGFRLSMLWRYAAIIAVILAVGCFSYWQGGVNGRVVGFVKYMKNVIENKWYIGTGLRFKIGIDDIRGAIHKQ